MEQKEIYVFFSKGEMRTSSLDVAQFFNISHYEVISQIESLPIFKTETKIFKRLEWINSGGTKKHIYYMGEIGFSLLNLLPLSDKELYLKSLQICPRNSITAPNHNNFSRSVIMSVG